MALTDDCVILTSCSEEELAGIGALIARVFPRPEKDAAHRARQLCDIGGEFQGPAEQAPRAFVVRDGDEVVAVAIARPRTVATSAGEMTVLGLAMVGSDPKRRGEGLGARVVRATFGMVDAGAFPFSLFQTSHKVRPFYERIGACLAENRIVNSLAEDPEANPFWDEVVMRYPRGEGWPEGTIDLRGPGY